MRFLTKDEKRLLIILVTSFFVVIVLVFYINSNKGNLNEPVVNNKVHIIHSGGDLDERFEADIEKIQNNIGFYDYDRYEPLISSNDISPTDWNKIASDIAEKYNKYNAFVVISGTKNLPYTASALSFILENLDKPIVITDNNITNALLLSSQNDIPEVMVESGGKLLRGCRCIHDDINYDSPNYPSLRKTNSLGMPENHLDLKLVNPEIKVIMVKIFPGFNVEDLFNIITNSDVDGIIFDIYCNGTLPHSEELLMLIKEKIDSGVSMVAVSECPENLQKSLSMDILETGIIPGYDMTAPAAFAKLNFLLSNVEERSVIGQLMGISLRGELTKIEN